MNEIDTCNVKDRGGSCFFQTRFGDAEQTWQPGHGRPAEAKARGGYDGGGKSKNNQIWIQELEEISGESSGMQRLRPKRQRHKQLPPIQNPQ